MLDFLTALRALRPPAWWAALAAVRARCPRDPALRDALRALSFTTSRLSLAEARRAADRRVFRTVVPMLARLEEAEADARRELSEAAQAALLFAAEWAAAALLVRDALAPAHFDALYAPFAGVIPPPSAATRMAAAE